MKEDIKTAISAHGAWKARLKTAIDSGKIETPIATIRQDNQCIFGKWLYGSTITAEVRSSPNYKTARELHADFHKAAGEVAELATAGKKAEAEKMLALGGKYADASAKLTTAMMAWLKDVD